MLLKQVAKNKLKCLTTLVNPRAFYASQIRPVKLASEYFQHAKTNTAAPPLITMHGLFGSKQNWRGISKALAAKSNRKTYTIDARNHGDSPHTSVHTTEAMTADIVEFYNTNQISTACVMGHSMGGRTMMHFALSYPQLVDRLIVVDISPVAIPRDFYEMNRIFEAMLNINVSSSLTMAEGRQQVKNQLNQSVDSNETVDFIMLNLRKRPDTGEFYWAANVKLLHESLPHFDKFHEHIVHLPPYSGPTTFICGNKSNFVNPDHWPQIQTHFPEADIHWLNAGHLVHFEQPQKFLEIIVDFLKR